MKHLIFAAIWLCTFTIYAKLPALIPREVLFGNPERANPQISPDGSQLSWLAPDKNGVLNVWVSAIDRANLHPATNETDYPIHYYRWAADGNHILYLHDNNGNEIDHLFSADLMTSNVRDLTPFRGVRAQNVLTDSQHPKSLLVALNLRDRNAFDMYRVDLETGAITLEATNPGDVLTWKTDRNFVIRAATAFDGKSGRTIIRVRDAADKPWRDLVVTPFEQALFAGQVVMAAWGFTYRSCLTWVKPGLGLGSSYLLNNTEHLLFGMLRDADLPSAQFVRRAFSVKRSNMCVHICKRAE